MWAGGSQAILYSTAALTFLIGAIGGYIAARLRLSDIEFYKNQLKSVRKASFQKQKLMNASEFRVFHAIERDATIRQSGFRIVPQPPLGEILTSKSRSAFQAINSKRVDMLIIDSGGRPLLAIEYQGEGHYSNTSELRDEIKSTALYKAGVRYLEVFPQDGPEEILSRIHEMLRWKTAPPGGARDPQETLRPHFGKAASRSV